MDQIKIEIPSLSENIRIIESFIDNAKERFQLSDDIYGNIMISVTESVNNAINHGNGGQKDKNVSISLSLNESQITFRIEDEGKGFDYNSLPDPTAPENLEKPSGRGIFLMRHLADEVDFQQDGKVVQLTFYIAWYKLSHMPVYFFEEDISFTHTSEEKTKLWIEHIVQTEKRILGDLNFIFCTDEHLHEINVSYLNHDTYTDIITFDNSEKVEDVSGDIFISIDRVEANARDLAISFDEELNRVMIHGVLHLIGFNDKSDEEKQQMREKEDTCLSLR